MLRQRILSAIIILIPVGFVLWWGGIPLTIAALVLYCCVNFELLSVSLPLVQREVLILTGFLFLLPLSYLGFGLRALAPAVLLLALIFAVLAILLSERERHALPLDRLYPSFSLALCYTAILGTVPLVVLSYAQGRELIIWTLGIVIASDTCAYFGGRAFGGEKLAPRISPNKTVSGAITGFFGALAGAALGWWLLELSITWPIALSMGALIAVLAQLGDLVESGVKRLYGVKDMSNLIPGHGGVLDRVDAFLFSVPALLLILR